MDMVYACIRCVAMAFAIRKYTWLYIDGNWSDYRYHRFQMI